MLRRLLILSVYFITSYCFAGGMPNSNSESESSVNNVSNSTDTQNQQVQLLQLLLLVIKVLILQKLIIQIHKQHKILQAVMLTTHRLLPMDFLLLKMSH